jgi:VWFA-related protein
LLGAGQPDTLRWLAELDAREDLRVPHALYRIDEIGQVRQIIPLTMDIAVLREGVEEIARLAEVDLYRGLYIRDANVERFALLEEFCAALAGCPGRTVLVYISMGISLVSGGMPDTRVLAAQAAMHEAANAGNVALYGVDPSLMYEIVGTGIDMSRQNGTAARTRAGSARDALGNSLRHAASATGGHAFVGWSELGRVIDHIEHHAGTFYALTFAPERPANDGQ